MMQQNKACCFELVDIRLHHVQKETLGIRRFGRAIDLGFAG